jgi:hypothetical protein
LLRNSSTTGTPKGKAIGCFHYNKLGHRRDQCPQLVGSKEIVTSKPQRIDEIPLVDTSTIKEPLDSSLLVGASGQKLLLEVEMEGQHQFLIYSGTRLSLVKLGVSQSEVQPTNMAAKGITSTTLNSWNPDY